MNGVGIGTTVGFGTLIGLGIIAPEAAVVEYVSTFAFYGLLTGGIFELYRFAFGFNRPSR